jgi:peroxiredoxin
LIHLPAEDVLPDVLSLHQPAPDFTLPADDGNVYTLSDHFGRTPVLLFFYPADFTPVCTAEVTAFRDDFHLFESKGITLYGVSADPVEKHQRFAQECRVPFRLLSDKNLDVARRYGAKGLLGLRRAYYYIDRDGYLRWQYAEILPIFKLTNEKILEQVEVATRRMHHTNHNTIADSGTG